MAVSEAMITSGMTSHQIVTQLRARVAWLERDNANIDKTRAALLDRAIEQEERITVLEAALAAAYEALKPLAAMELHYDAADFVYDPSIGGNGVRAGSLWNITLEHVEAAREARKLTEAVGPPCPSPPAA